MTSLRKCFNIAGIAVFFISFIVFFMSAERTGSLWDCGEFILGAHKLQVVHPPGAPLFLLIGRMFTWVADLISSNPSDIAFAVNILSGICTAAAATMAGWSSMMFGKLAMVGRDGETTEGQNMALTFAGIVAGLSAAFCSSVWFSAVEGEIYAMSTFFTMLTFWSALKWYYLPDEPESDRWLVFSIFAGGLSIGVHLLSLLTFPAIGLLYYYKKYEKRSLIGYGLALLAGVGVIVFIQKLIIVGIPTIWKNFDIFMVNSLGLPVHSGVVPTFLLVAGLGYMLIRYSHKKGHYLLNLLSVAAVFCCIAFTTFGTVVIRANADTPVNMNVPSDATRLLPYLNREQYGERPLLSGPHYGARPTKVNKEDRYGLVDGEYKIVDEKYSYEYANKDIMLFPRVGHSESSRPDLHRMWRKQLGENNVSNKPGMGYNLAFMTKYQISWMYWRYFMWNFVGRQNADQGYYPWSSKDGNWQSGISAFDSAKLYNQDELPDTIKKDKSRNFYYFLPLIFGLLGLIWHFSRSKEEFLSLLVLFVITGIGIIIYSNQPPNEPRERDYIHAGSFIAFSMWIGMGVLAVYSLLKDRVKMSGVTPALIAGGLALAAPALMGFQNFDDHSRADITAARDYATNFLNSVEPNAILFTYGDNDTYPLWYAQEVEGVRPDVRVVNLSLIAVDWYINKLRSKVNDSAPIKLSLSEDAIRGKLRNQIYFYNPSNPQDKRMTTPVQLQRAINFIAQPNNTQNGQTIMNSKHFVMPIDKARYAATGMLKDTSGMTNRMDIKFAETKDYLTKDDLAILDIISNNYYDRPIYFATTCRPDKLLGLQDYMQLEGLALRLIPKKNASDTDTYSIYGSGIVDVDFVYENAMNKWKWGNFDKKDVFVDRNYMAGVQSMKMAMLRTATKLAERGDFTRAANLANKYFEGFPHMNFAYDVGVVPFINVLVQSKDFDSAKKHMRILAEENEQFMKFYNSLDNDDYEQFRQDMAYTMRAISDVLNMSNQVEDPAFSKEMNDKLGKFAQMQQGLQN